jgi:hypothetical protein
MDIKRQGQYIAIACFVHHAAGLFTIYYLFKYVAGFREVLKLDGLFILIDTTSGSVCGANSYIDYRV